MQRLRVFETRVLRRIFGPKREEVAGGWRRLHNEELHNLYASLLTPWCRILFEKLFVTQLVKKISCFLYGTRRFITVFTKARHWTLS
jgi:hypothetical protein